MALAALIEYQPLVELAAYFQLVVTQITRWKRHLREQVAHVFTEASGILPIITTADPTKACTATPYADFCQKK